MISEYTLIIIKKKVYAHVIGTEQSQDVLVYEELDDTVFVDITSSKDGVRSKTIMDMCTITYIAEIELCYNQCKFAFIFRSKSNQVKS